MRFSDTLFAITEDLWKEALDKPFVKKMADGSLEKHLYANYMLQDYLYLQDYVEILKRILSMVEDPALREYLKKILLQTETETEHVHLPEMKKLGITEADIKNATKEQVLQEYTDYMLLQPEHLGMIAGLVALLQCSWGYAYLAREISDRHPQAVAVSPYREWFAAYTDPAYTEANRLWIEAVDRETKDQDPKQAEQLCEIFQTCARYENRFWDALYNV